MTCNRFELLVLAALASVGAASIFMDAWGLVSFVVLFLVFFCVDLWFWSRHRKEMTMADAPKPKPELSDQEFNDKVIAPKLKVIQDELRARGMPFVAAVFFKNEAEEWQFCRTVLGDEHSPRAFQLMYAAMLARGDFDSLVFSLLATGAAGDSFALGLLRSMVMRVEIKPEKGGEACKKCGAPSKYAMPPHECDQVHCEECGAHEAFWGN